MPLKVESVDLMPAVEDIIESLIAGRKPAVDRLAQQVTRRAAQQAPTQEPGFDILGAVVGALGLVAKPRISKAERRRLARLEREVNRAD